MKKLLILFIPFLFLFIVNASKAADCPSVVHIKWVGPGCDSITISFVFNMPCNGNCGDGQPGSSCKVPTTASTIVFEDHDGVLTIPCCASDVKVRVTGCGHNFETAYLKGMNSGANGIVIIIDDEGNIRVNGKK
jgi:hypothetical protein